MTVHTTLSVSHASFIDSKVTSSERPGQASSCRYLVIFADTINAASTTRWHSSLWHSSPEYKVSEATRATISTIKTYIKKLYFRITRSNPIMNADHDNQKLVKYRIGVPSDSKVGYVGSELEYFWIKTRDNSEKLSFCVKFKTQNCTFLR